MMKTQLVLMIIAGMSLYTDAQAQAGDTGGNGGDAVICPSGVRLLDSHATERTGYLMVFSEKDDTLAKKVAALVTRVAKKDLILSGKLADRANALLADVEEFSRSGTRILKHTEFGEGELPNVPDEGATFIPVGCTPAQLVIRTPKPLPNQKEYSIRIELWVQMSEAEQAATIFHEAVYGYLVDSEINSSPAARWYNGLVISNQIEAITDFELVNLMDQFGFPVKEKYSTKFQPWSRETFGFIYDPLSGVQYAADGSISKILSAKLTKETQFAIIGDSPTILTTAKNIVMDHGQWKSLEIDNSYLIDLDTLSLARAWSTYAGNNTPMASRRGTRHVQGKNVVQLKGAVLTATSDGHRLSGVRKYHWRLMGAALVPPMAVAQFITMDRRIFPQRYDTGTVFLDHHRRLLKVVFDHRKWRDMGRE